MRMEHEEIKQTLQRIGDAVGKNDLATCIDALGDVLGPHNQKEEGVLYPWLDESVPEPEKAAALDRIRRLQADAP
jgi:iron-sulfur cluster repair protein YtfE (RIC family)